jgi:hypothetical protein
VYILPQPHDGTGIKQENKGDIITVHVLCSKAMLIHA